MNSSETNALALQLIEKYNIPYSFKFSNAKRCFGTCDYRKKIISISKPLSLINPIQEVMNIILHEIAHALVGPSHGHDETWKEKAISIGCNGQRCHNAIKTEPKYIGTCPNGHTSTRYRKSKSRSSCMICDNEKFNPLFLFDWKENIDSQN